jgi:peptide/nickel transport system permease protein
MRKNGTIGNAPPQVLTADLPPSDLTDDETELFFAGQMTLIWRNFRKHKLAFVSLIITVAIYAVAIFAEFLAPYDPGSYSAGATYAPPQPLRIVDRSGEQPRLRLHVLGYTTERNLDTLALDYVEDPSAVIPMGFFVRGEPYNLFGLIPGTRKLLGPKDPNARVYLLGADRLGRDMLSRIIHGARISMSVGLVGVMISLILGITLGGISGYFGGRVDDFIQRLIEFVRSIPTIPLWLGLAAAVPRDWSPIQVYFAITVILSAIGWTSLARTVRGKFLAVRTEDFVLAAQLDNASQGRIIFEHMLPSFTSHIIASMSLAIPQMIISETALSFLGLGLREPAVSWGVLLQNAQNIRAISQAPWLLLPALAVIVSVLALNFVGDGLRDAADPYS